MIRLQENYESPRFRNKVFSYDQFVKYYKAYKNSETFTYYEDWSGFNVPGHIVNRFFKGKFNPLRKEEKKLLSFIRSEKIKGRFYLLGYAAADARVKKHEIAHGLFYTNRKYKKEVLEALGSFDMVNDKVSKYLRSHGYHQAVVPDEFHAWTLTDSSYLKHEGLWNKKLDKLHARLYNIFKKHTEFL